MPWQLYQCSTDTLALTAAEIATLGNLEAARQNLPLLAARVLAEARGYLRAGGYGDPEDQTLAPPEIFGDMDAIIRARWLATMPSALLTEARQEEAKAALENLKAIGQQKRSVQPVEATASSGPQWNSANPLIPRTHPTPPRSTQFNDAAASAPYANTDPDAQ